MRSTSAPWSLEVRSTWTRFLVALDSRLVNSAGVDDIRLAWGTG